MALKATSVCGLVARPNISNPYWTSWQVWATEMRQYKDQNAWISKSNYAVLHELK